jgi:hypothetical protein
MRDKGLVFEEMRRHRRDWRLSWGAGWGRWFIGLAVLVLVSAFIEARRTTLKENLQGPASAEMDGHREPGRQVWGARHGAKSR